MGKHTFEIEFAGIISSKSVNIEKYEIEEIEVVNLDEGSTNSANLDGGTTNSGANIKDGMIHGKEYTLKVTKFKNDKKPNNLNSIKWAYTFNTDDGGSFLGELQNGEEITFKADEIDLCGKNITFYAFIHDREQEASLPVFHHYRFRWFDRSVVEQELDERVLDPSLIEQNGTSLCGMASLFYIFAGKNQSDYKAYCLELHTKGEINFPEYSKKISKELFEVNPVSDIDYPSNFRGKMPYADWISLAGTRNMEYPEYKGKDGEDFDAINWPWVMTSVAENIVKCSEVSSTGCYNPVKSFAYTSFNVEQTIKDLNKQINDGYKVVLMIDSDMIQDDFSWNPLVLEYHWIVLDTVITSNYIPGFFTPEKDEVSFKAYTWKSNREYLTGSITHSHFYENYYGYIKLK